MSLAQQLDKIGPSPEQIAEAGSPQPPANVESKALDAASIKEIAEAVHKILENKDFANDIKARRKYAKKIFKLVARWLAAVLIILVLHGCLGKEGAHYDWTIWQWHPTGTLHFFLEQKVLLALIGGTTTGVVGLFLVVTKYLFREKN